MSAASHDPGGKVTMGLAEGVTGDAAFSPCGRYRHALLRAIYKVETIADPPPGAEPEGVWADLLAVMETDEELCDLARYWRQLIAGTIVPIQCAHWVRSSSARCNAAAPW